ncbi:MAG: response regulator transcription factor [Chloroflexota bacterium]
MEAQQLRILVLQPEIILRHALMAFLEALDDLEPVGEAKDAASALELCQILRPDVILMEVQLPDMDGIQAIRRLQECCPGTAIVVLTSANQCDLMKDALLAGATGWLENWMGVDQVVAALRIANRKTAHHAL